MYRGYLKSKFKMQDVVVSQEIKILQATIHHVILVQRKDVIGFLNNKHVMWDQKRELLRPYVC